jgi:hypothetical protein
MIRHDYVSLLDPADAQVIYLVGHCEAHRAQMDGQIGRIGDLRNGQENVSVMHIPTAPLYHSGHLPLPLPTCNSPANHPVRRAHS